MKNTATPVKTRRPGWAIIALIIGLKIIGLTFVDNEIHKAQDDFYNNLNAALEAIILPLIRMLGVLIMMSAPLIYLQWPKSWWKEFLKVWDNFRPQS